MQNTRLDPWITRWLISICLFILMMVFVGGITRLTHSGLSMVDWRPIMGIIPPLSEADWVATFGKYQAFPEYRLLRPDMTLDEFKAIFYWEYIHRLLGRLLGLAFFLPFVFFWIKGVLSRRQKWQYSIAFCLGGAQGLMGWYMVQSGLVDDPRVSHLRLASHLGLALFVLAYLFWLILGRIDRTSPHIVKTINPIWTRISFGVTIFVGIQIFYGAFVAGLDAGLLYNTFPKMNERWIPEGIWALGSAIENFFYNPTTIQFIHRFLGVGLALGMSVFSILILFSKKFQKIKPLRRGGLALLILVLIQLGLGIGTLVWRVPVPLAVSHQMVACLLLLASLYLNFLFLRLSKGSALGA